MLICSGREPKDSSSNTEDELFYKYPRKSTAPQCSHTATQRCDRRPQNMLSISKSCDVCLRIVAVSHYALPTNGPSASEAMAFCTVPMIAGADECGTIGRLIQVSL